MALIYCRPQIWNRTCKSRTSLWSGAAWCSQFNLQALCKSSVGSRFHMAAIFAFELKLFPTQITVKFWITSLLRHLLNFGGSGCKNLTTKAHCTRPFFTHVRVCVCGREAALPTFVVLLHTNQRWAEGAVHEDLEGLEVQVVCLLPLVHFLGLVCQCQLTAPALYRLKEPQPQQLQNYTICQQYCDTRSNFSAMSGCYWQYKNYGWSFKEFGGEDNKISELNDLIAKIHLP